MIPLRCDLTIVSLFTIVTANLNTISAGLKVGTELDHRDLSTLSKSSTIVGISLLFFQVIFALIFLRDSPTRLLANGCLMSLAMCLATCLADTQVPPCSQVHPATKATLRRPDKGLIPFMLSIVALTSWTSPNQVLYHRIQTLFCWVEVRHSEWICLRSQNTLRRSSRTFCCGFPLC